MSSSDLFDVKDPRVIDRALEDISYNLRRARLSMAVIRQAELGRLVAREPEFEATLRLMNAIEVDAHLRTQDNLPLPSVFMKTHDIPQRVTTSVPPPPDCDGYSSSSYVTTPIRSFEPYLGAYPVPMPPSQSTSRSTTPPPRSSLNTPSGRPGPASSFRTLSERPSRPDGRYEETVERELSGLRLQTKALDSRVDVLEQRVVDRMSKGASGSESLTLADNVGPGDVTSLDLLPSGARSDGSESQRGHTSSVVDPSLLQDMDFDPLFGSEAGFAPASTNSTISILDYLAQLEPSFGAQLEDPITPATPAEGPSGSDVASQSETTTPALASPSPNAALNRTGAGTRKVYFHNLTPHHPFPPLKLPDLPRDVVLQRLPGTNAGAVLTVPRTMEIEILKPVLSLVRSVIEKEAHGLIRPVIRPGGHPMAMLKLQGVYFSNQRNSGMTGQRVASSLSDVRREVELRHPVVGAALVPLAEGGKTVMLSLSSAGGGGQGGGSGKRKKSVSAGSGIGNGNGALPTCDVALQVKESRVVQVQAYLTQMADPTKMLLFGRDTMVEMLQLVD